MLELENIHAYYGESHVLRGVSLSVAKGEVVCLLGRNGAGKTTTILTVMGYLHPRDGHIRHNGRDIGRAAALRRVAAGRRLRAAGARDFPKPHGARKPDGLCPRQRQGCLDAATHLRPVPEPAGARAQSRLPTVRRRAADALDRPRADAQSGAAAARRAVGGAGADDRRGNRRACCAASSGRASPSCWSSRTCAPPSRSATVITS